MTEVAVSCLRSDADGIRFTWEAGLIPSFACTPLSFYSHPDQPCACFSFLGPWETLGLIRVTHQQFLRMRAAFKEKGGKKFAQCSSRFLFSKLKLALLKKTKTKNEHFRGFSYYVKYCFGSELEKRKSNQLEVPPSLQVKVSWIESVI